MDPSFSSYSSSASAMTLHCDHYDPHNLPPASLMATTAAVKEYLLLRQKTSHFSSSAMDDTFLDLALRAVSVLLDKQHEGQSRIVIAIGGTPGSGKSTLASRVSDYINEAYSAVATKSALASSLPLLYKNNLSNSTLASEEYCESSTCSSSSSSPPTATGIPIPNSATSLSLFPETSHEAIENHRAHHICHPYHHTGLDHDDDDGLAGFEHGTDGTGQQHFIAEHATPVKVPTSVASDPLLPSSQIHPPTTTTDALFPTISFAAIVPMDGFHLTRAQLDQFPDPVAAHARRGSPWTFDVNGVVSMAQQLHNSCFSTNENSDPLLFPAFDHAAKDPQPNGIVVNPSAKIILLEGLYTLLNTDPWSQVSSLVDQRWLIQVPLETTRLRLARRHLASGIVSTLQEGYDRVDSNDSLNAQFIMDHSVEVDCKIQSIDDFTVA